MLTSTFARLQQIRDKYGAGIFGKIAQKMLALAFLDAGFSHVVERGVQGVDIDAVRSNDERYSLEVKTTDKDSIPITNENLEALKDRVEDGYIPLIAALRMKMFEDWVVASIPLSQLSSGNIPLSRLRPYRISELEKLIRPPFENVVNQHYRGVMAHGENYLIRELQLKRGRANP